MKLSRLQKTILDAVSFLRNLIQKDVIIAYALAWHLISGKYDNEFFKWQGRGRRAQNPVFEACKDDTPTFRLLELTDEGWEIARGLLGSRDWESTV